MADKNYRDASTGQFTTAADAAARPAETVAETTPTRPEAPDVAELRRLLDAATARPWMVDDEGDDVAVIVDEGDEFSFIQIAADLHQGDDGHTDAHLIVAAVNALPDLLGIAEELRRLAIAATRAELRDPYNDPATHVEVIRCAMTHRDALAAELAHIRESRAEAPNDAELRRRLDALPGFTLKHLHGGPGGESYIALGDEGGMPLSDSGFDAVLFFAEIAALEVPRLLDRLAHMTEARDNARAEVERLTGQIERVRALADLIDRHTEFERDPVDFRDASHGGSWDDVADRIRRILDGAES